MAISKSFHNWVDAAPDWLQPDLGQAMIEKGFVCLTHHQDNDGPWLPSPGWEELVEALGGEDAIEADYDGKAAFTVRHRMSGREIQSNGAIDALARLWLEERG